MVKNILKGLVAGVGIYCTIVALCVLIWLACEFFPIVVGIIEFLIFFYWGYNLANNKKIRLKKDEEDEEFE